MFTIVLFSMLLRIDLKFNSTKELLECWTRHSLMVWTPFKLTSKLHTDLLVFVTNGGGRATVWGKRKSLRRHIETRGCYSWPFSKIKFLIHCQEGLSEEYLLYSMCYLTLAYNRVKVHYYGQANKFFIAGNNKFVGHYYC